jgi:hypothetical protein
VLGADIRTLIRLFQSDNRTMDILVRQHNDVLQKFVSALPSADQGNGAPSEVNDRRLPSQTQPLGVQRDPKGRSDHDKHDASEKAHPAHMVAGEQNDISGEQSIIINGDDEILQEPAILGKPKLYGSQVSPSIHGKKLVDTLDSLEGSKRDKVLNSLCYRHMLDRQCEIEEAYTKTFDWLFGTAGNSGSWDDYITFLKSKSMTRPYWINGKAGSGNQR